MFLRVEKLLCSHEIQPAVLQHMRLSLEELIVNIISYGYEDHKRHTIELKVDCRKNHFVFCLNHDGVPFNPLAFKSPPFPNRLEDRKVGGLGILLAKSFMDEMSYKYIDGCNQITLIKKVNPEQESTI
ncbi:MAG: ATP-binding protein [Bdellovibrionales bacterium]|nr:ATP-binding protein [Bdellovibrionales bacterium]